MLLTNYGIHVHIYYMKKYLYNIDTIPVLLYNNGEEKDKMCSCEFPQGPF